MAKPEDVILGIDLGTTNSLVAVFDEATGSVRVLTDEHGNALVPSVVRFCTDEVGNEVGVVVGSDADERVSGSGQSTSVSSVRVSSVKRLIGRSLGDVQGDLPYLSYEVVAGERDTARVVVARDLVAQNGARREGGMRTKSPEEVSGLILAKLKQVAQRELGHEVTKAVVTVPAYFDDAQRQATRVAGRLAGLDVVRIVPEPTAAALAYGIGLAKSRFAKSGGANGEAKQVSHVAVYDLGGGTFDVSILRITPGDANIGSNTDFYQVLATSGDTHLGGDDFDQVLSRELRGSVEIAGTGNAGGESACGTAEFMGLVRRVRHELSEKDEIVFSGVGGANAQLRVTRARFDALMQPLVDRTVACCERAVVDARKKGLPEGALSDVLDAVILVGGATRTPLVRRAVRECFGIEPYTAIDPDQAVAIGAAVQAGVLSGAAKGSLLLDVIPLSLGIETVGGAVAKLIMRNSTVPTRATEMFSTSIDNQASIRLSVYQGEREMAADCRKLAEFQLRGLPAMPAGLPQVEVSFLIDANGVLSVQAVERRSGKAASLQVIPNLGLTGEEVERIERESIAHAREDMARHRIADLVSHSGVDLSAITRTLARVRALLEPTYVEVLESRMKELRSFIGLARQGWQGVDANAFQRAKEALDKDSMRLHEVAIAESLRESLRERGGTSER